MPAAKPLLVGQAPGANTDPEQPLYPAPRTSAGGRLAAFMGLSPEQYLAAFERVNLIEQFPGRYKRDDKFPLYEARIRAAELKPTLRDRVAILMGRNVAVAWGAPVAQAEFFSWVECPHFGTRLAVVPHPSGRNHWYNVPTNRDAAMQFWKTVVARLLGELERVPSLQQEMA